MKILKWFLLLGVVLVIFVLTVENTHQISMESYLKPGSNSQQKIVHDIVNALPSLDGDRNQR